MNFLLVGHAGSYNRGCEAIVQATLMMIKKEFREPSITISAFKYHANEQSRYGEDVKIVPAYMEGKKMRFSSAWFTKQALRLIGIDKRWQMIYQPIISELKNADVVLSIGGDNYTDDYGSLKYFLDINKLVKIYKKKFVIWGASIGPFSDRENISNIANSLKLADLITVRESKSMAYLNEIGVINNVKLVADPAFILPVSEVSGMEYLDESKNKLLGFNISPLILKCTEKLYNTAVTVECIKFLKKVLSETNHNVLLIPHVIHKDCDKNDHLILEDIYKRFVSSGRVYLISSQYNAMETKYIISKCDFFIGARTHSTIASLSTCVPTISIGYSLKSQGINKDIFGHEDYLLKIGELNTDSLFGKFTLMTKKEAGIRNLLYQKIPEIQKRAWDNVKYLCELLKK